MAVSHRALMNGNVVVTNWQLNYLIKVVFKKMQREDRKLSVLLNNVQCWQIVGRVSISSCRRRVKYGDVREWKCSWCVMLVNKFICLISKSLFCKRSRPLIRK
jgi:hypothetical protein